MMNTGTANTTTLPRPELAALLSENAHLRAQVTELQAALTKVTEERRENDLTYQVTKFHQAFGYPVRFSPVVPSEEETRFRLGLISEEYLEVLDACGVDVTILKFLIKQVLARTKLKVDLPALAKEYSDLDFVVEGSRLTAGIPRQAVANEVSRSNLEKRGGPKDANGKQLKPPGWKPPDIERILRECG